jgi:methylamine dehydrogenase accessory protein MauD
MDWMVLSLVTLLTLVNSIAVIGLIRQIGVLHLRIQPVAGLKGAGGPELGRRVNLGSQPLEELARKTSGSERFLLGFISPTCSLCAPLLPAFEALSRANAAAVLLVSDTDQDRAREYLNSKHVRLPVYASEDAFHLNDVPAAPFVVITDREGRVTASGGVNSLEQIELLIEDSVVPRAGAKPDIEAGSGDLLVRSNGRGRK